MKRTFLGAFLLLTFFTYTPFAHGATLYMDPNDVTLLRGDTISVSVRLDTDEGECVNVVDAVITYPPNIEPVDTSRGSSIFSMWVEEPTINKQERTISFAGGIPNGYCGRIPGDPRLTNTIVELLFRSPGMVIGAVSESDVANIEFAPETSILLNDGFGSKDNANLYGTQINLSDRVGREITNEWSDRVNQDIIPPQQFSITLEKNNNAFSNQYYIIFNTTDKESGVDHYEVIEEPLEQQNIFSWGAETAPWIEAKSPYVLDDQSLNSTIRVRAIDKAGNEYIATLVPDESQRTLSVQGKIMIALIVSSLVVFVVVAIAAFFFTRSRFRRGVEEVEEGSEETEII